MAGKQPLKIAVSILFQLVLGCTRNSIVLTLGTFPYQCKLQSKQNKYAHLLDSKKISWQLE